MDTLCRDCVFAQWDGRTQVGCDWNRLDKFDEVGTKIMGEEDKATGKQYFRICGRICNTCRHPTTLKGVPARKWKEKVREEIKVRIAMMVYVDSDEQEQDCIRTLESFRNQTATPHEIVVIYNNGGSEAPPAYAEWLSDVPTFWRVEQMRELGIGFGKAVDLTVDNKDTTSVYYTVCRAGYTYPINYVETIDKAINDDLDRFVLLLPDRDGDGLFAQVSLHKILSGNVGKIRQEDGSVLSVDKTIIDKIREVADSEGTGHLIKRYEELRECV